MKRIRGGNGLGDAIYVRAIAAHLLKAGEKVTVCTSYPGVFSELDVGLEPFTRFNIDVLAHYTAGKNSPGTNQWQDICSSAKVDAPLGFEWTVRNQALVDEMRAKAAGRPLILVGAPHVPMDRKDGFGMELLPDRDAFQAALAAMDDCFTVQVGHKASPYQIRTDAQLNGGTSVTDLLDLGRSCDALIGQCSFVIPLAEVFDKPLLIVWAARGMEPQMHHYIRSITPQKVLSKPSSSFVVDDWPVEKIQEAARAFRS